ncbi:MFS transporter [Corynebacterium freiburgense]|uniref:MFS transporter n=1 Tax=Corynebacterium freiburgense TaxID=556548 RepID=UPI0004261039|nr:MFS transporter [Corynebacterium freiburgense]WJZ02586.1 putative transport protein HsrA [Corynebacterium freiburgense]
MKEIQVAARNHISQWRLFLLLGTSPILVVLDTAVLAAMLPEIAGEFSIDVQAAYHAAVVFSAICLPCLFSGPWLVQRFSQSLLCFISATLFCLATAIAALSQTIAILAIGKGMQGIAVAILLAVCCGALGELQPRCTHVQMLGNIAAAASCAVFVGISLASAAIRMGNWRFSFWAEACVYCLVVAVLLRNLPDAQPKAKGRFDSCGLALFTLGFCGLLFGIIYTNITLALIGCLAFLAFVVWERLRLHHQKSVLIDIAKIRISTASWKYCAVLLTSIGRFGFIWVLPFTATGFYPELVVVMLAAICSPAIFRFFAPWLAGVRAVIIGCAFQGTAVLILIFGANQQQDGLWSAFTLGLVSFGGGCVSAYLDDLIDPRRTPDTPDRHVFRHIFQWVLGVSFGAAVVSALENTVLTTLFIVPAVSLYTYTAIILTSCTYVGVGIIIMVRRYSDVHAYME